MTSPDAEKKPGTLTMISYGMGRFIVELLTGAFTAVVFKFYETEIGLASGLVAAGFVIHSVWNAVTYPLVGYMTQRPTALSARFGRRFPWIVLGAPLSVLAFLLVFAPPSGAAPFILFVWLVVASCLFDAFHSLWELNYQSIYPDKFRDYRERGKAAGIGTVVGTFGVVGGSILPTLFIVYGSVPSYFTSALVIAGIGIVAALLLLPGVRETPSMIARFVAQSEKISSESGKTSTNSESAAGRGPANSVPANPDLAASQGFYGQLREAFRHKNFVAFILLYFFYQAAVLTMQSSIYYVGDYVLDGKSTTAIFACMLAGALISVPFWLYYSRRVESNQNTIIVCAVALAATSFPMTFIQTYLGFVICIGLWGIAFGGFWFLLNPAMADVVDDIVVKTGRRQDGLVYGFRAFFGRLALVVQALSFWIIHAATNFNANPRSPSALFGIHIHLALLPTVLILLGALVYWKLTDLNRDRCAENRAKLADMGL